ncbi:MAG: hypothetical protein WCR46_22225 [Deltaproteobacteria bacterium]
MIGEIAPVRTGANHPGDVCTASAVRLQLQYPARILFGRWVSRIRAQVLAFVSAKAYAQRLSQADKQTQLFLVLLAA